MLRPCEYCQRKIRATKRMCKRCAKLSRRIANRISCAKYYAANSREILASRKAKQKALSAPTIPMDDAARPCHL